MMTKAKRDKLFKVRVEGDAVELNIMRDMFPDLDDEEAEKKSREIMRIYWAAAKRQERETRCLNAGRKTRCNGKCSECSRTRDGQPISTNQMEEDGMLPQDCFSIEVYIEQKELYQALYAAIDMLDEKDRQIILLIFWGGRSEREIETDVGLKQSAINSRKRNVLRKLKEILKDFA